MTWLTKNVVGIKPVSSGVVIIYQVNDFTCTSSMDCFIAWPHIYPSGLDSVLTDSIDTPELDASIDEADAMPSSVS